MKQVQHNKTGFWYPENSGSQSAIKEAYYLKDYGGLPTVFDFKDKVVMDCGGHIGTFSRRAFEEGAKEIHIFEPFPSCVESIRLNLVEDNYVIHPVAIGAQKGTVDFHYRESRLEGSSMIHKGANQKRWNYQTTTVECVNFWDELDTIRPDILKMDIEGEEWNIFQTESLFIDDVRVLPDYVKVLLIEVHGLYSKGWEAGIQFIEQIFPNSKEVDKTLLVPFKSKPDKVTNVSALFVRT